MGKQMNVELIEGIYPPEQSAKSLREADLRDMRIRRKNFKCLRALQKIMLEEEDRVYSIDEVLARVLKFYDKFVPFKSLVPETPTEGDWISDMIAGCHTELWT